MKRVLIVLGILALSTTAFAGDKGRKPAQDAVKIACSDQARNLNLQDAISMIRSTSPYNDGTQVKFDIDAEKSPIYSRGYDEAKDQVTYESTIIGEATHVKSGQKKTIADQCSVRFQASTCKVLSITCGGSGS